jgi:hypothetical protein
MFAVLEFTDYVIIGLIVSLIISPIVRLLAVGSAASTDWRPSDAYRLFRLERKLDLILKHLGIEYAEPAAPGGLSEEVRRLAHSATKIRAIKLHREQTGLGLKEAKDAVEAYMNGPI